MCALKAIIHVGDIMHEQLFIKQVVFFAVLWFEIFTQFIVRNRT